MVAVLVDRLAILVVVRRFLGMGGSSHSSLVHDDGYINTWISLHDIPFQ
jgi:hypothetical protein